MGDSYLCHYCVDLALLSDTLPTELSLPWQSDYYLSYQRWIHVVGEFLYLACTIYLNAYAELRCKRGTDDSLDSDEQKFTVLLLDSLSMKKEAS